MIKKAISVIIAALMCVVFSGCDIINNNTELVAPPELTGETSLIADALYKSVGADVNLKYPASGDRRSAIVLEDINGDGAFEAFAFYSTSDDEMTTMHINVICQRDGEWVSASDKTMVAMGVESVDFCDLNNDGVEEIIVGWEVNGNTGKQLCVFAFEQDDLTQLVLQAYTDFMCCDIDNNGVNEIFVHLLNTAEKTNKAMIFTYDENGMAQTAGCVMDGNVKSTEKPILSTLSNGQKAIYIDEIKGVGAVTEVLYMLKGQLVNPLLDTVNSFENISTLRAAALTTKDINADEVLEVPVASDLPNAGNTDEKLYYTNWCSFNGEKLSVKLITVVNTVDGYYLALPNNMIGKIAVLKDIDNHERTFYSYDQANDIMGSMIFKITAVDVSKWEREDYPKDDMVEILKMQDVVFACKLGDGAEKYNVTVESIKEIFKLVK